MKINKNYNTLHNYAKDNLVCFNRKITKNEVTQFWHVGTINGIKREYLSAYNLALADKVISLRSFTSMNDISEKEVYDILFPSSLYDISDEKLKKPELDKSFYKNNKSTKFEEAFELKSDDLIKFADGLTEDDINNCWSEDENEYIPDDSIAGRVLILKQFAFIHEETKQDILNKLFPKLDDVVENYNHLYVNYYKEEENDSNFNHLYKNQNNDLEIEKSEENIIPELQKIQLNENEKVLEKYLDLKESKENTNIVLDKPIIKIDFRDLLKKEYPHFFPQEKEEITIVNEEIKKDASEENIILKNDSNVIESKLEEENVGNEIVEAKPKRKVEDKTDQKESSGFFSSFWELCKILAIHLDLTI